MCPPTTLFAPLEDFSVEEVSGVDASRLGATMSMLQEVIRSVEDPSAASGSGNVSLLTSTGEALTVVDVEKSKEPTAPGM